MFAVIISITYTRVILLKSLVIVRL